MGVSVSVSVIPAVTHLNDYSLKVQSQLAQ